MARARSKRARTPRCERETRHRDQSSARAARRAATAGGPGRTRTSNQTVMSGLAVPEIPDKTGVFRHVHARSFASVHGVSVVNLWSVLGRCDHWRSGDALMMPHVHRQAHAPYRRRRLNPILVVPHSPAPASLHNDLPIKAADLAESLRALVAGTRSLVRSERNPPDSWARAQAPSADPAKGPEIGSRDLRQAPDRIGVDGSIGPWGLRRNGFIRCPYVPIPLDRKTTNGALPYDPMNDVPVGASTTSPIAARSIHQGSS
jgi:hypothetical protein